MAERKTRSNGRETMKKVLVHALRELDEVGPVKFNILRVIENSGVSRSSVYHHFGGRDGVIAAVEVERLVREMQGLNDAIRLLVTSAEDRAVVLAAIRGVLEAAGTEEGRRQRAHRIAVMAAAQGIPVLAETLREEQAAGDAHVAVTLGMAAERGLMAPIENAEGVAHLVSSLFIGRAIVDVIGTESADTAWVNATMETLEHLLPPGSPGHGS